MHCGLLDRWLVVLKYTRRWWWMYRAALAVSQQYACVLLDDASFLAVTPLPANSNTLPPVSDNGHMFSLAFDAVNCACNVWSLT